MLGPRARDSRSSIAVLDRKKSTKQLISRFESLAPQPSSALSRTPSAQETIPPNHVYLTKKDKSSVRQSFRNLMGLFKKGDSKFKVNQVFNAKRLSSSNAASLVSRSTIPPSYVCMTGTVLYMARVADGSSPSSVLPVWTTATAALKLPELLISSVSINGHPDTHSLPLKDVSDVRSLIAHQIDPDELAMLPKDYDLDDLRFFELVFDGRPMERFAVTSIHERADWVSSIWDAVLSCRGRGPSKIMHSQALETPMEKSFTGVSSGSPLSERPLPQTPRQTDGNSVPQETEIANKPYVEASQLAVEPDCPTVRKSCLDTHSVITLNKPLPLLIPEPGDLSLWSATGAIVDAYADTSLPDEPFRPEDTHIISRELEKLSLSLTSLEERVAAVLKKTDYGINNVNSRMDRTENALLKMSQDVTSLTNRPVMAHEQQPVFDPSYLDHISNSVETLQILSRELRFVVERLEEKKEHGGSQPITSEPVPPFPTMAPLLERLGAIETGIANSGTEMLQITTMLKGEVEQRNSLSQQQTDSVRYLNELNTWLESFVNNGASQIQFMHGSVEQIRHTLGCEPTEVGQGPTVVALLHEVKGSIDELRGSIGEALSINRPMAGLTSEQVVDLIARQNQHQETLFRGLTAELTSEIRGERMRFVDAMKEATEINVQSHVEDFKKELKREVHGMMKEVGRLYKERQTMENQIAELLAFHTRQKQGIVPFAMAPLSHPMQQQPPAQDSYQQQRSRPQQGAQGSRPGY
ncbi:hypothetical protein CPB85DRAFT_1429389 [Mucidula mucida]|nr:hypothetical protein CPB85DRAFT_1429389 [Mucidula mucida]